jgi:hypothetical protein
VISDPASARALFVDPLLVTPEDHSEELAFRYDDERDVTVVDDGIPLVEMTQHQGTGTSTKSFGEHSDADDHVRLGVGRVRARRPLP